MSTQFYTRDQNGQISEFNCIEDALESFLSYDGYRLDILTKDVGIFIRRDELPNADDPKAFDAIKTRGLQYDARIFIHKAGK